MRFDSNVFLCVTTYLVQLFVGCTSLVMLLLVIVLILSLVNVRSMYPSIESTVIIGCIAKEEEPYLHEWISYHIGIGFDHIFIADNSDAGTLNETLFTPGSPTAIYYPQHVTVFHLPGKAMHLQAWFEISDSFKDRDTWGAFFDIDEFIVLHKHDTIKQLLYECTKPFGHRGAVSLNWALFGSNGHKEYSSEPVTKRFTRRQATLNPHVKTIAYLPDTKFFEMQTHTPVMLNNRPVYDCYGNIIAGPYNSAFIVQFNNRSAVTMGPEGVPVVGVDGVYRDSVTESVAVLHHYFTKSYEEWVKKRNRGLSDMHGYRALSDFELHDFNEVEDKSAYIRYCSIVGQENC